MISMSWNHSEKAAAVTTGVLVQAANNPEDTAWDDPGRA